MQVAGRGATRRDKIGEAGVPSTRGFGVMGWDADHAPKPIDSRA